MLFKGAIGAHIDDKAIIPICFHSRKRLEAKEGEIGREIVQSCMFGRTI